MEVRAVAKNLGVSAQKMRLVVDLVRGKSVTDAINILKFTPTPSARLVAKVVKSAAANAEHNFQLDPGGLKIVKIYADVGTSLKRFRPRSRGQVSPIIKRSSHVTVIVAGEEA
jgi:large subunit ribosomal protein L22